MLVLSSGWTSSNSEQTHQLRDPSDPLRRTGRRRGDVRVVRPDRLAGRLPAEKHFPAGEGEGDASVLRDGRPASLANDGGVETAVALGHDGIVRRVRPRDSLTVAGVVSVDARRVRLVENRQGGKVLPRETGLIRGAGADIRRE